jgi:integrase
VSPCLRIALPKGDRHEIVPLEVDVVSALAEAMPSRYRALIMLAAGTGLRQGECFGLTVDRVDFLRSQVRVDRQLVGVRDGRPVWGPPKSEAGFRTVPMPGVVTDALSAHLATWGSSVDGLFFTNSQGAPLRRSAFGDA